MSEPHIDVDLFHDWADHLRGKLNADGVHLPPTTTDDKVCIKFYGYEMRFPIARSRHIHKARNFSCPPAESARLANLEQKIRNGDDLRPHLSTSAANLSNKDMMLLEWGIHHFHLGIHAHPTKPGYVARTGPLLYARLTDTDAYFIGVLAHGAWANDALIRVLHDNWPDSIAPFRMQGVVGLAQQVSSTDRQKLRKAQINSAVDLGSGIVYGSPGLGFALSGDPIRAVNATNSAHRWFKKAERRVRQSASEWTKDARDPTGSFKLKLELSSAGFFAVDPAQNVRLPLGDPARVP